MLIQKIDYKKLGYYITIAFLVLGLSVLSTMSAQAGKPTKQNLIGPEGGTVDAGNNSYLLIPENALLEPTEIQAASLGSAVATEPALIVDELIMALTLLYEQYDYVSELPGSDDGSGEWAKHGAKWQIRGKVSNVEEWTMKLLISHDAGDGWESLYNIRRAFKSWDELDTDVNALMNTTQTKMGLAACEKVLIYSDQVRPHLETVDSLYYGTLNFEFGPHGTEFLIPAELVIPWIEISISDELFWYSGDSGETIDIFGMDYWIDDVNETVHFFIYHFSQYYFSRR